MLCSKHSIVSNTFDYNTLVSKSKSNPFSCNFTLECLWNHNYNVYNYILRIFKRVLGLKPFCPWPRDNLSSATPSLALASDFFRVLGLGLEGCVLAATSDKLRIRIHYTASVVDHFWFTVKVDHFWFTLLILIYSKRRKNSTKNVTE